jgi:hypothetical protein
MHTSKICLSYIVCYVHVLDAVATVVRSVNFEKCDCEIPNKDTCYMELGVKSQFEFEAVCVQKFMLHYKLVR